MEATTMRVKNKYFSITPDQKKLEEYANRFVGALEHGR